MAKKLSQEDIALLYKLRKIVEMFDSSELKAFSFIWDNISVGEILFEQQLIAVYKVAKPIRVIQSLREKGVIERGEGCYNLARWLRNLRKKVGGFAELKTILEKLP